MLLKYKEISKKFQHVSTRNSVWREDSWVRLCTEDAFFLYFKILFFLKFLFCTEMHWNDPWKRSQKPELKLRCHLLEFKNDGCFFFPCRNKLLYTIEITARWAPSPPGPPRVTDQPGTAERWEPHGSCGCQHRGTCTLNSHQLQTEGLNSISIILLCSLGSFLPARWNFAGSTVNVSLFFCLRLQLKWQ